jgi:SAM-dependent methyltransferase
VGCGTGGLLDWLKKHGWHVYGVEISKQAAEYGNKYELNIFNGELIEAKYPSAFFDVVVINQVLEHLYDPKKTLKEIHRILKTDGTLIVGVPNIDSYEAKVFGRYWSALDIPRHLYHFNLRSLKLLVEENNFNIKRITNTAFFIPHQDKNSLSLVKDKGNGFMLFLAYLKIYLLKPFFYFYSQKLSFGAYITLKCSKLSENDEIE